MPKNEKRRVLKEALKIVDGLGDLIENSYFFQDGDSYFIDDELEDLIKRANNLKKSNVWKLK